MLALAAISGLVWVLLLLSARHRLESGKPASQPGSREARGLTKASGVVGAFFGGLAGASFGSMLGAVACGVAMLALSLILTPRRKPLKSGKIERRRIEGTDRPDRSQ